MQFIGTSILILFLIVVGFLVAAYILYTVVKNKIREATGGFNIDKLSELSKTNKIEMQETPKSVNGMESVLRPSLERDFPDMSLEELKSDNIDEIFAYYSAIENFDISHFEKSETINSQLKKEISENKVYKKKFSNIKIHKQAMSDYRVLNNVSTIVFQVALEYMFTDKDILSAVKTQKRIETQWIFLPDEDNFNLDNTKGFNCPNCGAPISNTNNRVCTYCSTAVEIDFTKTWRINSIIEI